MIGWLLFASVMGVAALPLLRRVYVFAGGLVEWEGDGRKITIGSPTSVALISTTALGVALWGGLTSSPLLGGGGPIDEVAAAGGTTPTLTATSADIGTKAGGGIMHVTGSDFESGMTVSLGDTSATVDSLKTAGTTDTAWVTIPRRATAVGFDTVDVIACNGAACDTIADGFEYGDSITATHVSHNFNDSTDGDFTAQLFASGCSVSYPSGQGISGRAARFVEPGGASGNCNIIREFATPSYPVITADNVRGLWQRWYQRFDGATIDSIDVSGQIKIRLQSSRPSQTQRWPTFVMGAESGGASGGCVAVQDENAPETYLPDLCFVADEWREILVFEQRDTIADNSLFRLWVNRKHKLDISASTMGTSAPDSTLGWAFGMQFTQNTPTGDSLRAWVDDAVGADGVPLPTTYLPPP